MNRSLKVFALAALVTVASFGQSSSSWRTAADVQEGTAGNIEGTVVDVDAARGRLSVEPDEDRYQRVTIVTDSVSTQYNGFGGMINDAPEIYKGSTGFANIRVGDRIRVRGIGRGSALAHADQVTLLGRSTPATQVGVGETRPATSVSTPTATSNVGKETPATSTVAEGTVRQLDPEQSLFVIETPQRRLVRVRGNRSTPVYWRGQVYRISNMEVGDYVRVETSAGGTAAGTEIAAVSIEVTRGVQESGEAPADQRLTTVIGEVSRVDKAADMIRVDNGRETVRVDMIRAVDSSGQRLRAADLQNGDRVDITGSYSSNSDVFVASTVRIERLPDSDDEPEVAEAEEHERGNYAVVSFAGTVAESLQSSPMLVVRDRTTNRNVEIWVTEDFVFRTKAGTYSTADKLAVGDLILLKAFRDEDENLIAQSIRIR